MISVNLKEKVAVITGGANGIGKATAKLFAQNGAKVVIWDYSEKGEDTANELRSQGLTADFQKVNTADLASVNSAANAVFEKYGRIDILVNNAGILRDSSFSKMEAENWQAVLDVNLTGVFNCTKAIVPFMQKNKFGRVLNASSIVGVYGNFGQANYAAAKAGVIGLTKTLARELGRSGITVNAVAPGYVQTDMTASIPEEFRNKMIESIPVKRAGVPEDIANAYLFLASEEASFINGAVLHADGGMTM
jgi:3-oxoacyl-[acyl-carrier protein] reductase